MINNTIASTDARYKRNYSRRGCGTGPVNLGGVHTAVTECAVGRSTVAIDSAGGAPTLGKAKEKRKEGESRYGFWKHR